MPRRTRDRPDDFGESIPELDSEALASVEPTVGPPEEESPPAEPGSAPENSLREPEESTAMPNSGRDTPEDTTGLDLPPAAPTASARTSDGARGFTPVVFVDMRERNNSKRTDLTNRRYELEQEQRTNGGTLPPVLALELRNLNRAIRADTVVDPLYLNTRDLLGQINPPAIENHLDGKLPSQRKGLVLSEPEKALAAVYGLLEAENLTDPTLSRFVNGVSMALGEYTQNKLLFGNVLNVLINEGNIGAESDVHADWWASVVRRLRDDGVVAGDPLLTLKTRLALAAVAGAMDGASPSAIAIDLPDLEAQADREIVADNLHAMQAIFFSAMLEDVKLYQVVDKLLEEFQNGMLPLGKGNAGNMLYAYWKKSIDRMTEVERRNLYARTFGFPGGDTTGSPNREFADLWLRFVSAVSSFVRQFTIEDLIRTSIPLPVSQEQVRKAGQDLAANLSLHGYGIAYFAATELQTQIQDIIALLSDPEIKSAYGARDMWQVIDQVATLELGGAKNSVRQRVVATSGAIIIRWLAKHADALSNPNEVAVLDLTQIRSPQPRPANTKATVDPSDMDLVNACNQWLAVTGTQDKSVEEYAQPTVGPNVTSRPIQIPQIARDMLESVGVHANGLVKN